MSILLACLWLAAQAPAPPGTSLADELARARDEGAILEDRLAAARRAHGLAANAETAALLRATYLDVERGELGRVRTFERVRASCASPDDKPVDAETCVRDLLVRAGARRLLVNLQGDELLVLALGPAREPDGLLHLRGLVRRATQQRGVLAVELEVQRSRGPRDPAVEAHLLAPPAVSAPAQYQGPVLSEGARRVLGALPERYVEISGEPGRRFIQERCAAVPPARTLTVSILGQAQLTHENGTERSVETLLDAWKVERGVELAFEGGRTLRVLWPTAEKNVADWSGVAWATTETFPRKPAQGCAPP